MLADPIFRRALLAAVCACFCAAASAGTVTTTADSGAGSLRDVLAAAASGDVITFTVPLPATITLTGSELPITKSVTIQGPGADKLTIQRVGVGGGRLIHLDSTGKDVMISGVTLTGGSATGNGGAILNDGGNLTLLFDYIHNNTTTATGGAIFSNYNASGNQLFIANSTIYNNTANKSGAIDFIGFKLTIENSTIGGNSAVDSAGAINLLNAEVYIYNSTFVRNLANFVGGINSQSSTVTFESTVMDNDTDSTAAPNDLNRTGNGTVNATNSLFSEAFNPGDNVINGINSGNIVGVNLNVAAATDNGGTMPTAALLPGSPARGSGSNSQGFIYDQRGAGFPRNAGGSVDMGAIQSFVTPIVPAVAVPVPTLDRTLLVMLSLLVAGLAFGMRRRR